MAGAMNAGSAKVGEPTHRVGRVSGFSQPAALTCALTLVLSFDHSALEPGAWESTLPANREKPD